MIIEYNGNKYVAQCGCRDDSAIDYVKHISSMPARFNDKQIESEFAEGIWLPSPYIFVNETLYKKIGA
jgi:hypothetical protein